jgi:hypothetical protein
MLITFLQLEFQKSTLWTPCNRTHKTLFQHSWKNRSSTSQISQGTVFNFECFSLHNTCSHLQWPQMISLWHRNPNGEIIRTAEGITWGNTIHAISSSRSIGDELNWANYGVVVEVDPPAMSTRYGQQLSWSTSVFMRKNYLKNTWRKTTKALRLVTNIWNCFLHL